MREGFYLDAGSLSRAALALIDIISDGYESTAAEEVAATPLKCLTLHPYHTEVAGDIRGQCHASVKCGAIHAAKVLLTSHTFTQNAILHAMDVELIASIMRVVLVPRDSYS